MTRNRRNHERGAVALVIAVMWTALFGMAVMAVDFGYLYTKKRGIQSVTDSALKAAMPVFKTSGRNAAETRAREIARLSGYVADATTTIEFEEPVISEQFKVTVGRTHPTFFGGIFGLGPRAIKASATGKVTAPGGVAIHAKDNTACAAQWAWGAGIEVTGGGLLTVNGDVTSVNKIHIGNPSALCNGVNCRITGAVQTPCTFWNDSGSSVMGAPAAIGGSPPDPLAANTLATLEPSCSFGTSTTIPLNDLGAFWVAGPCPGGSSLPTGVYCSASNLTVAPIFGTTICPSTASFVAAGPLIITGDGAITLTAAPGTNGIIAFSNAPLGGPAIQLANGPLLGNYTLNGSVYAPNGLVNVGTGTPGFNMTGILDGFAIAIAMGPNQPWTFNAPAGGGGPGWTMLN